jgi:hypothetical protein
MADSAADMAQAVTALRSITTLHADFVQSDRMAARSRA